MMPAAPSPKRAYKDSELRYEGGVPRMSPATREKLKGAFTPAERAARDVAQPHKDFNRLYDKAALQQHAFEGVMKRVGRVMGAPVRKDFEASKQAVQADPDKPHVVIGALKGRARAQEKVDADYQGHAEQLTDLVRGTVLVPHADDLADAVATVRKSLPSGWTIVKPKNRYVHEFGDKTNSGELPSGYRDISLLLRAPNGFLHELQINTTHFWHAKEIGGGHTIYEMTRAIEAAVAKSQRQMTRAEFYRIRTLNRSGEAAYRTAMIRSVRSFRRIR